MTKPATFTNNFLGNRPMTQGGQQKSPTMKGDLFDDPDNYLHGDLD